MHVGTVKPVDEPKEPPWHRPEHAGVDEMTPEPYVPLGHAYITRQRKHNNIRQEQHAKKQNNIQENNKTTYQQQVIQLG